MCVIAVSEAGVNAPTEQNLKDMFDNNDDGAGISFVLDHKVYTYKGLMTWLDFQKTYALLEKKLKSAGKTFKDVPVMYHFRIGTHGPNSAGLTHPFPISHNFKHLSALELSSDIVMAHNGIINSVSPRTGWSDTQQYIKDIVLPLIKVDRYFYKNKHFTQLLENTINGSRLAFLDNNGQFNLVGSWRESDKQELKGIKYSNLNHENSFSWRGYGYNYGGGYLSTYKETYKEAYTYRLPKGSKLYVTKDLDNQEVPLANAKPLIVGESVYYFVDEYGETYQALPSEPDLLYPIYTYDYAVDDKGIIFATRQDIEEAGRLRRIWTYEV